MFRIWFKAIVKINIQFKLKNHNLKINEKIYMSAVITYQDRILDMSTSFTIDYRNHQLAFVEY